MKKSTLESLTHLKLSKSALLKIHGGTGGSDYQQAQTIQTQMQAEPGN